jgi:hypothetical protein
MAHIVDQFKGGAIAENTYLRCGSTPMPQRAAGRILGQMTVPAEGGAQ